MKHPVVNFNGTEKPSIDENFEFEINEIISDDTLVPKRKISFSIWDLETQQDLEAFFNGTENGEMPEIIGERLKQNFIDLIKNKKSVYYQNKLRK